MSKLKKLWLWYCMFNKRLFRRCSYIVLLCLIPVLIPLSNMAMQEESGVLTIMLCSADHDATAEAVIEDLMENHGIMLFYRTDTVKEAVDAVKQHKADAAWVLEADFGNNIQAFAAGESLKKPITIYEREETVPLQLTREKLIGAVYRYASLGVYTNFVQTQILTEGQAEESVIQEYYDRFTRNSSLATSEYLNADTQLELNYLTMPLRGILSMMVMLCGFAAVLYYLKDQKEGKYDWLPIGKRSLPAFASCFSAIVLAALAVLVSLCLAGLTTGFWVEFASMLLFILMTTGFCLCFCRLFKSVGRFGAMIPGLLVAILILSPIFFDASMLRTLQLMLPTYYYLNAIYKPIYLCYALVYCVGVYALAALLNLLLHGERSKGE